MSRAAIIRADNGIERRMDGAQVDRLIDIVARAAPYKLPLYEALANGAIDLCEPQRGAAFPRALLEPARRPTVTLIGDDDHASTGPAGYPCARRFAYWAAAAIVHAAKGEGVHYSMAVEAALLRSRMLMIETDTAHADEWRTLLGGRIPVLMIRPKNGPHPLPRVVQ